MHTSPKKQIYEAISARLTKSGAKPQEKKTASSGVKKLVDEALKKFQQQRDERR